ncbi:hypothetical protein BDZ91DRAFT_790381 [Kalaharituber pfeilii]|nr:hypothetical protein BDZ91DRAFT_790381 [Kalaharituber pfeilii]
MSTPESSAPKSRGRHRTNKSGPAANIGTSKSQFNNPQNAQRHGPPKGIVTPPQSPKANNQLPTASSKKKRKSKPRPRDVNTDPNQAPYQGYESPTHSSSNDESNGSPNSPSRAALGTPTKAYAGPNFHSSPAPSSLPVPSWFSKSVPATPSAGTSLQAMLEMHDEKIDALSRSLEEPESHLQKLFRADKEEKARNGHRNTGIAPKPALASLANSSPVSPMYARRRSPDASELNFPDIFSMDNDKKLSPPSPYEADVFQSPVKASYTTIADDVRKQTDALRSFLNQPLPLEKSVEKSVPSPVDQVLAPATPAKRRPSFPRATGYSPPRAPLQTPSKKQAPYHHHQQQQQQQQFNPDHQPRFVLTSKGTKVNNPSHAGYPQTPSPKRDHSSYPSPSYSGRKNIQTDSVIQVAEMEEYLRRILNLESRAIATPAVAS